MAATIATWYVRSAPPRIRRRAVARLWGLVAVVALSHCGRSRPVLWSVCVCLKCESCGYSQAGKRQRGSYHLWVQLTHNWRLIMMFQPRSSTRGVFGHVISQKNISQIVIRRARNAKFRTKLCEIALNTHSVSPVCFQRWRPPCRMLYDWISNRFLKNLLFLLVWLNTYIC